ncbi:MAG: Hsp20/alpha crystallin family protein [Methanomicrobiales archaeon]|nr:Hsp20/alpha crystallin family protein [Methanomicrobiales archaeon]
MKKENEARKPARKKSEVPFRLSLDRDRIHILAELEGISEEKIRLDLETTTLVISAIDGDKAYKERISLPWEARLGRKRFRKGVLELTLEKADI